ncbi:MAG TPA: hypothetical protein VMS17_09825, partial [Gemmataceae bacterium]|nr:hypothetical protein [Gemmataceae bacterium]
MRRLSLFLLLAALPLPLRAADAPAKAGGDLYILGVGLDQEPSKADHETIDAYNWCPEEIEKLFKDHAADFHRNIDSRLVLGKKATHQGVLDGFTWLRDKAHKNDLVVIYIGCHGFCDANEGWGIVAADGKTLWGHEVKAELGKLPCNALVLIETCTSGGFASPHKNDPPVPPNVTCICACSGKQETDNQLDMAVAEALYGRADFNHDGVVDVDELIRYVQLRYREWWPNPKPRDDHETPVIVKSDAMPGAMSLTKAAPNLAAVFHEGRWLGAVVEKQDGDKYAVHMLGWANRPGPYFVVSSVGREEICLASDGPPLLVKQDGAWRAARLLSKEGEKCKIHYIDDADDETVTKDRIRYPFVGDLEAAKAAYATAAPEPVDHAGEWEQVGTAGAWRPTIAGAVLQGRLYTAARNKVLRETDLGAGEAKAVGKPGAGDVKLLFAAGDRLCAVDRDGSLFQIDPKDGDRRRIGDEGAWKGTLAGAVLNGKLYTAEKDGGLYVSDLDGGDRKQIGKAEFGDTKFMFAA